MKAIYLVLDMENDLVNAEGPNGKSPIGQQVQSRDIVARTARALAPQAGRSCWPWNRLGIQLRPTDTTTLGFQFSKVMSEGWMRAIY